MNSVAEIADTPGDAALAPGTISDFANLNWLQDGDHPLDWNGPADRRFNRFPDCGLERPILAHLECVARKYGSSTAISDEDSSFSFAELWEGLCGLASTIEAETKAEDLIGIAMPACSLYPVAMLACLAAGRPFVALDPHYPDAWLRQVLEEAQPSLILISAQTEREDAFLSRTAGPTRRIRLSGLPKPAPKVWRPAEFGVDQPACVLFTSGSSGRPKGIVNSQRNLLQRVAQSINAAHINSEDTFLTLASLCTIVGVRDALTALLAGARVHLIDPQRAGAREIAEVIREEAITILFAFPALLRSVVTNYGERPGCTLRLVRIGGDTTLWSDIDLLRGWVAPETAIQLIYAATEAPMMQWFVDESFRSNEPRIPIGYPLPGNRLAVVDEYGRNTPPGETGELIVGSPYVALGLWAEGHCVQGFDGAETQGEGSPRSRFFRTGDMVRQRADGLLERIGRKDRQVKIRGSRVDLEGVEAALRRHPFVKEASALIRTSADGGVRLVAYVCAPDAVPASLVEELNNLMSSVPAPMRPARIYLADRIPRLPSSKPDLRALVALDEANARREAIDAVSGIEAAGIDGPARTVARVWAKVLDGPVRTPQDDFYEAGGDSLKAILFMNEIEQAMGLKLPLTLINQSTTFGAFCQSLREHRSGKYVPLVCLKACAESGFEDWPPVFFVHGLGGNVSELFPLARRMAYPGAVIAIQARGLAGEGPPHGSVSAMASEYLAAVKARQPSGPYYLCGYSFGGLVAFEMARQLAEAGEEVGLVGLFDTMMSPVRWPLRAWLSIIHRRLVLAARAVRTAPLHLWLAATGKSSCPERNGDSVPPDWEGPPLPDFLKSSPSSVMKVAASALIASARYRPAFYEGELTLFSPAGREPGLPSLQSIWRRHARAVSVVETIGTHWTMMSAPNAGHTAACLTQRLPVSGPASLPG